MKKQLLVAGILSLISWKAYALTGKDSWAEIRSSRDVLIQQPTFAGAFGKQGLFNACATEDEFRSRVPVKTCVAYKEIIRGLDKDYVCAEYDIQNINISRVYVQDVCTRYSPMNESSSGECLDYKKVTSVYPTSFQFPVIEAQGEDYGNYVFSKTYSVPSCE